MMIIAKATLVNHVAIVNHAALADHAAPVRRMVSAGAAAGRLNAGHTPAGAAALLAAAHGTSLA